MFRSVYIGLGSNRRSRAGDSRATLTAALCALDRLPFVRVERVSAAYRTAPVGPPQPPYVNAAAMLRTSLPPEALLAGLLAIERSFGRQRSREARWGPRTLDLDFLLDGESVLARPGLAVPHPRLPERAFVLEPLAEIAPQVPVPSTGRSIRSLLVALDPAARAGVRRLGPLRRLDA
ncbi:MAG: 2-amino-4-hydroxy-6-hydroxymethyldihydropteridine diphosphokinase [Phycisphaerae bacterium]|nr:2-amino-4-hydroxy-6-hydroxymethyldihydropteridine diphosphokinase [Phycisphaerae bacterium]